MNSESIKPDGYFPFFTGMSLYIASLNSGSNGNCYYVGNEHDAVLIDAGISCRETEIRLNRLGLSMGNVRAIFISHEHTDHTYGVEVLVRRYPVPVYLSEKTFRNSKLRIDGSLVRSWNGSPESIGSLAVTAFSKRHDASDPHSFTVTGNGITVGVFTDIGSVCENLIQHFSSCHAAFLEANYDEEMLAGGRYPQFLKNRISSDLGHLSNRQALELFRAYRPPFMTHLLLSHLSRDNNDPRLVLDLFGNHSDGIHLSVASRDEESALYLIDGDIHANDKQGSVNRPGRPVQLKFFDTE
jgi:phosphoribosyl 1,2-cyclic phosphodiesterase